MPQSCEKLLKLHEHTLAVPAEAAGDVDEAALWEGLKQFVRTPERFNEQVVRSSVTAGASDMPQAVFERTLDFGSHQVADTGYLNPQTLTVRFDVHPTQLYPRSVLSMQVHRTPEGNAAVTFTYQAERRPDASETVRALIVRAWEQKDAAILKRIIADKTGFGRP